MSYNASKISKELVERFKQQDKLNFLHTRNQKETTRNLVDVITIILLLSALLTAFLFNSYSIPAILALAAFVSFTIREIFIQDDKTIVRIYGPMGRLRYLFEDLFRDKFLQYFNETNTDGRPIPRIVRDYIYQKAKNLKPVSSFGTELDTYDTENTINSHLLHLNFPGRIENVTYGVVIGDKRNDVKPFEVTNTINISAMSYGSINWKAAESLSIGAKDVAYVNTGEGGYGPHGVAGNDVVFQIGTGKFGVGSEHILPDGKKTRVLDDKQLKDLVKENENIRMIQIKISQGAKPGLGGLLPGIKVTHEIASVRKVPVGETVYSPSQHAELLGSTPKESIMNLMEFIKRIRGLTELPVGIKLCIGRFEEIDLLIEAMKYTKNGPDAIQVDGADGGTGAGENIFLNYVGYGTAIETVEYLNKKLIKAGLRDNIVISTSGRLFSPAHAAIAFAYGADTIETARGVMLALGCIQSLKCHTGECPTGITTHSKWRMHGIVIPEKSERVHYYLEGFHDDMLHLTKVLGHSDPKDITTDDIRIVRKENDFSKYFENDNSGFYMPSPQRLGDN